jgi:hypothetical protein
MLVCWSIGPSIGWLVCPHITLSAFFLIQKLNVFCLWNRDIWWLNLEALITKGQSFLFRITSSCTWFGLSLLGAKSTSILDWVGPSVRRSVRRSVRPSVRRSVPHDARLRGKLELRRDCFKKRRRKRRLITSRFDYVAIPSHLGIRRSPCFFYGNGFYFWKVGNLDLSCEMK